MWYFIEAYLSRLNKYYYSMYILSTDTINYLYLHQICYHGALACSSKHKQ